MIENSHRLLEIWNRKRFKALVAKARTLIFSLIKFKLKMEDEGMVILNTRNMLLLLYNQIETNLKEKLLAAKRLTSNNKV